VGTLNGGFRVTSSAWIRSGLFVVFLNIGVAVFLLLGYCSIPSPYRWTFLNWNHFGIVALLAITVSIVMAFMLFRRNLHYRRVLLAFAGLVILYSFLFFIVHFEENGNISFNGLTALAVLVSGWILSAFPFIWKNRIACIVEEKATDYALLATSVMWLSPFLAELLVLLDWQLKGEFAERIQLLVLGGNGLNDLLFILGFVTFISTGLYALLATRIADWLSHD
jgi:hypothetical protein